MGRQNRTHRPPGELAVADLAAAGRAEPPGLAHRIGREIVVQHEGFLVGPLQRIDELLVLAGAERGNHQCLGLAAGEQRRAVSARQDAYLGEDRTHRPHVAAVDADAAVEDVAADDRFFQLLEHLADDLRRRRVLGALRDQRGDQPFLDRLDGRPAFGLAGKRIGDAQIVFGGVANPRIEGRLVGRLDVARLLGGALGELDDGVDHRLEALVAEHHRPEHVVLGELLRLRFDHQDGVGGAGDDEVELRFDHLVDLRVEDEGAADQADPGAADRTHEGQAGEGQRGGGGDHRHDVGIVLKVMAEDGGDNLRLASVAVGEERADWPVDQAGGQRLLFARTALALEEAAGNLAGGEGLLLVVHGEREEVDPGALLGGADDGGQHRGLAIGSQHRTVRLACDPAGLQHERASRPFDFDSLDIKHGSSFHTSRGREGEPWTRRQEALPHDNPRESVWRSCHGPFSVHLCRRGDPMPPRGMRA